MAGHKPTDSEILKSHHLTLVEYPCVTFLKDDENEYVRESLALMKPYNVRYRYEPGPLVNDKAVRAHAFRDSSDEVRVYSVNPASIMTRKDAQAAADEVQGPFDIQRLIDDMTTVQKSHGMTQLLAVTYATDLQEEDEEYKFMVRIFRGTVLGCSGAFKWGQGEKYEFPLKDLREANCQESWIVNLMDLIGRRTDLACLHVKRRLSGSGIDEEGVDWLSHRHPNYMKVLMPMTRLGNVSAREKEEECAICRENCMRESRSSCHVEVEGAEGPEVIKCPIDREPFIKSKADLALLTCDIVGKEYREDPRFTKFENIERSHADLDKARVENSNEAVKVSGVLLKAVLDILTEGAKAESNISRPFAMQAARCKDFPLFEQSVTDSAKRLHGTNAEVRILYAAIMIDFLNTVKAAFKDGGLVSALSNEEWWHWLMNQNNAAKRALRPGFYEHVERTVNRMISFILLRECNCTTSDTGLHKHGGRTYYNPEAKI